MTKLKIQVNKTHIQKGRCGSAASCPVALAIQDHLVNQVVYVGNVGCDIINLYKDLKSHYGLPLPRSVNRWISRFDLEKPVKPFNFFLNIPS